MELGVPNRIDAPSPGVGTPPGHQLVYDATEVESYLADVRRYVEEVEETREELRRRLAEIEQQRAGVDTSNGYAEATVGKVLVRAQAAADEVVSRAQAEADAIVDDARRDAEAILAQARQEADTLVVDARTRVDAMVADAERRASALLTAPPVRTTTPGSHAEEPSARVGEPRAGSRGFPVPPWASHPANQETPAGTHEEPFVPPPLDWDGRTQGNGRSGAPDPN